MCKTCMLLPVTWFNKYSLNIISCFWYHSGYSHTEMLLNNNAVGIHKHFLMHMNSCLDNDKFYSKNGLFMIS